MKIDLVPFRSTLKASESQVPLIERFADELRTIPGWEVRLVEQEPDVHRTLRTPGEIPLILALSGGIEERVLQAIGPAPGPIVILAHPHANSLPASLEILARLRQMGKPGRIVFAVPGYLDELASLFTLVETRRWFETARIGLIGDPSDWLVASSPEDAEVRSAWGPVVNRIPSRALQQAYRAVDLQEAQAEADQFAKAASGCLEPTPGTLLGAARLCAALRTLARDYRLNGATVRCFDLLGALENTGCYALARVNEEGLPAACEGDVPALLTMMLLHRLGRAPAFMANPAGINTVEGRITLAHCTVPRTLVQRYTIRSHFESGIGAAVQGEFAPGNCTVARIGGRNLRELFVADGQITGSGSDENLCRTQVHVRIDPEKARTMLEHPLGNHHVLVPGHLAGVAGEYHRLFI